MGKYEAQQAVGVLVRAALPWTAGGAEEYLQPSVDTQLSVLGHLRALVTRSGTDRSLIRERRDRRQVIASRTASAPCPVRAGPFLTAESATFGHAGEQVEQHA